MKIGILCAGDEELAPFLPEMENCQVREKARLKFYEGTIGGVPVVALYSGVCKVNAAIAAQVLIDSFGVDAILHPGVAGGMDPSLEIFDTVVSTEAAYHDVAEDILTDFHPWIPTVFFPADPALLEAARRAAQKLSLPGKVYFGGWSPGSVSSQTRDGRPFWTPSPPCRWTWRLPAWPMCAMLTTSHFSPSAR